MEKLLDPRLWEVVGKLKMATDKTTDLSALEAKLEEYEVRKKEYKKKANVMSSSETGAWAELVRSNLYVDELYSQIASDEASLIGKLPWSHGDNHRAASISVSIKGEVGKFTNATEYQTTDSFYDGWTATTNMATARLTLPLKTLENKIGLSIEDVQYAVDENLLETVKKQIVLAARNTIDDVIINGDSATSGNINYVGWTPTSTNAYLSYDNSIRELGISNTIVGSGTFSRTNNFLTMLNKIDRYANKTSDLLWVMSNTMYNKANFLSSYSTQDVYWPQASVFTGRVKSFEGIEAHATEHFPNLTQSDGKINATSGSNTLGSFALLYKPAIQYAFWIPMRIFVSERAKGFLIETNMSFGFNTANETAGLDKTVWLSANVTV